jgi:hypothetical protein
MFIDVTRRGFHSFFMNAFECFFDVFKLPSRLLPLYRGVEYLEYTHIHEYTYALHACKIQTKAIAMHFDSKIRQML